MDLMNCISDYQIAKIANNKNLKQYAIIKIVNYLKKKGYTAKDIQNLRK